MFSIWTLSAVAVGYFILLFAVALYGSKRHPKTQSRPWVYSLALGIHCTTWSFYGTVAQSAAYGWAFTPTYIGCVITITLGYPLMLKIAQITRHHNISSIADLISLKYSQSALIARLITLVCLVGIVPYIALQLDAITRSVNFLSFDSVHWSNGSALYVAIGMAMFTLFFGTNSVVLTDKHPGLMLAIAFQSIIKLVAFLIIGVFICFVTFDGILDLVSTTYPSSANAWANNSPIASGINYVSHILLGVGAMLCLPRQFHINFVENNGDKEIRKARWIFPFYLFALNLFILPIALAGNYLMAGQPQNAALYVLMLPVQSGSTWLPLVGFIGGLAAASSMLVVSTLAMGIMLANNFVTPIWLKIQLSAFKQHHLPSTSLMLVRRLTIVLVITLSYFYSIYISQQAPLANSGIISLALIAQLLPGITLGILWKKSKRIGLLTGLGLGIVSWYLTMLSPSVTGNFPFNFGDNEENLALGVFISVGLNFISFVLLSYSFHSKKHSARQENTLGLNQWAIKFEHLQSLSSKMLPPERHATVFAPYETLDSMAYAPNELINQTEMALAAQVGSSSAKILLDAIADAKPLGLKQLVELVEDVSQTYQSNQEILQSSIQHIEQGISVVDKNLRLLAWNKRYLELFNYPENFIKAGMSLSTILRFNAQRGYFGDKEDIEAQVNKRLDFIKQRSGYRYRREQTDGRVVELKGNPMPGGGFVTTYTDITEYMNAQRQLEEAKEHLEERVSERTRTLQTVNEQLQQAKISADKANNSKTKFLAAAGHDLMQPFNAASLFAAMIEQKASQSDVVEASRGLSRSLQSAEDLLTSLLDMTKLETGLLKPQMSTFNLREITDSLIHESSLIAKEKALKLDYIPANVWIHSDIKLFKRILQNLISNAIRYTPKGKVLLGCRRTNDCVIIQVYDTGLGIPEEQQTLIFEEFMQLSQHESEKGQGLGLGLTIVDRISRLLGHTVSLNSVPLKGTCFSVRVKRESPSSLQHASHQIIDADATLFMKDKHVLIIDNDPQVLEATRQLLENWGASVMTAMEETQVIEENYPKPDLILADYHLNQGHTGVIAVSALFKHWQSKIPTLLNSANYDEEIRQLAIDKGFIFLNKPLKSGTLKRAIKRTLNQDS